MSLQIKGELKTFYNAVNGKTGDMTSAISNLTTSL